ncbi:hypothetical protein FOC1_g10000237 [Fusarium oxysporum f. sp. cubense race 1]|uniref:Uncharacterized protein n=1 Tax=Fusarium oxysporum f. sp. cubense (strain race 1) TaxID=1229664 RepID=N4U9H0_FUSC1|nr:hypothetical protein FOC1_g10000237 [Fusarium oxysporum f. sp. cubense race 1]
MFWRTDTWSASSALEADGSPVDEAVVFGLRCVVSDITLTTHFDKTCSLFELSVPIKIKDIRLKDDKGGENSVSTLILRICPSTVDTFSFASTTTGSESTRPKFTSYVTRLDFRLSKSLDVLVPASAQEPLIPARAYSGAVLDSIRQLSNATSLFIYVQDNVLSKNDLQYLTDAFSQGLFKSVRSSQHALARLYGGNGAKIIRLSAQTGQSPPPYREITPPPPSAPIYNKKRPRQDSQNERDNDIAQIWAVLAKIKERDTRNEALENENRWLRKEMEELRERVAVLEKQKDDNEHVEAQTNDNTMALVDVDVELADMREDIRELKAKADSVERGELVEMVKHDVLDYMRVRLFDD